MEFNVQLSRQLLTASLICGAAFGVLYDILRLFRAFTKNGRVLIFVHDMLFCLLFSAAMCVLYYNYTGGRIRVYALLAACGALAVYRLTLGAFTARFAVRLHAWVARLRSAAARRAVTTASALKRKAFSKSERSRQLRGAKRGFGL